jgi:hypothetical protein
VPLAAVLLAAGMALAPSCPGPDPVLENDAGDDAWVQRSILFLWGRRPESPREAAVLVALIAQSDRAAVARAMTRSPDYSERWEEFLYDAMAVPRVGVRASSACWDVALLSEDPGPDLAAHILAGSAARSEPFGSPFTMRDVTRSALRLDDLSVLYRAGLFPPLTTFFDPPNILEAASERREMAEVFVRTHLDRNLTCVRCHNSEFSVTDSSIEEDDRSWPLPGHVEAGVFGVSDGRDINEIALYFRRRGVVYQFGFDTAPPPNIDFPDINLNACDPAPEYPGCFDCPCETSVCDQDPSCCEESWTEDCAILCSASEIGCMGEIPVDFDGCGGIDGGTGGCAGCACEATICDRDPDCCDSEWDEFCAYTCREQYPRCRWYNERHARSAHQPWGMHEVCGLFVPPADIEDDITGDVGWFIRDGGADAAAYDLEEMLAAGAAQVRQSGLLVGADGSVDGEAAFAWLVGVAITDRVWKEAFGRRLTLSHNLPRNAAQRDRLMISATAFVRGGFSLADLVTQITLDPMFNQRAPAVAEADSPYYLPRVLNPWTVEEEDEAVRDNNLGDGLHQLSPRVRLRAAHRAMGWAMPPTFPVSENAFHARFQSGIGTFQKHSDPGFDALGLQSLLVWEEVMGLCRDPGHLTVGGGCVVTDEPDCDGCTCRAFTCEGIPECCTEAWGPLCVENCRMGGYCEEGPSDPDDWIASLLAEIELRSDRGQATTWEQAVATVKGRVIAEPWIVDDAERAATEALLGFPLRDRIEGLDTADDPLRRVCGALLTSPQFLLAGVPPIEVPEDRPTPVVVTGTRYAEHCEALAVAMYDEGVLDCSSGTAVLR